MEITFIEETKEKIAILENSEYVIRNSQDATELLMNCRYSGSNKVIIHEENLDASFFELETKIAGEILQKFSIYDGYLAIIGNFTRIERKSLKAFIYESNKVGRINFVSNQTEAVKALDK